MTDVWYALQVRSQRETKVAEALRREGQIVLVPVQRVIRMCRNSRGQTTKRETEVIVARGYVFSSAPWGIISMPWGRRQRHDDVLGTLAYADGRPAPIADGQMTSLKRLCLAEPVDENAYAPLVVGDIVKLVEGVLSDRDVVVKADRGDKVDVEYEMLGATRVATVGREAIAA